MIMNRDFKLDEHPLAKNKPIKILRVFWKWTF